MKRSVVLAALAAAAALTAGRAGAAIYWDTDGATLGSSSGATVNGTWGTDAFWSPNVNGDAATVAYTPNSDVVFSAEVDGNGTSTIALTGNLAVNGITLEEGTLTFNSTTAAILQLGAGGLTLASTLHGNAVFSTSISGGTFLTASQTWTNASTRALTYNSIVLGTAPAATTRTLTVSGSAGIGSTTFGGVQDGSGGGNVAIVKTGGGTLTLGANSNSYTGGTTISGGIVQFGTGTSSVPAGASSIVINAAGTLAATGPTALDTPGEWIADGRINPTSTGTIGITAANATPVNFTGYNTLFLGGTGSFTQSGTITPGTNGYRLGGGGGTLTVDTPLDAAAALTSGNSATVILRQASAYTGLTTLTGASTLIPANNGALGANAAVSVEATSQLAISAGTTITGKNITVRGNGANNMGALSVATVSGVSTGTDATWAGDVTLGDAATRLGARAGLRLIVSGGVKGSGANQLLTISGESGTGTVRLSGPAGSSDYTGRTDLVRGKLEIGATNTLPQGTLVDMHVQGGADSTTFDLNGFDQRISGLRRSIYNTASTVTNSAGTLSTLTINVPATINYLYGGGTTVPNAGVVTGPLKIVKEGDGTQTFGPDGSNTAVSPNTYSGGSVVVGGVLAGVMAGAFGSGDVEVQSTGIRISMQTGNLIADTATLSLAGGGVVGTADFGFAGVGTGVTDTVNMLILGGVVQNPGTYGSSASAAQFKLDEYFTGAGVITVLVPEPTSAALVGAAAFAGLCGRRPRRRA